MSIADVIVVLNQMVADAVIEEYAIGGAVGATFFVQPVATVDVDVFVAFHALPGSLLVDIQPVYKYLLDLGCRTLGEYIIVAEWPVQFLPAAGPLVEEAIGEAIDVDVEGAPARVFTPEHLAAVALQTGRAKDKARLLMFLEAGVLDRERFEEIVALHRLGPAWEEFKRRSE